MPRTAMNDIIKSNIILLSRYIISFLKGTTFIFILFDSSCKNNVITILRIAETFVKIIFQFLLHHQSYLGLPFKLICFLRAHERTFQPNRSPYCSPVFILYIVCIVLFRFFNIEKYVRV